jgi:UDP-2,3-diacylglucosamine pyrophosphatase LpxH
MSDKQHHKTIVISDVHLGTSGSKVKELIRFLRHNTCDTLILNGDIIDGWQLRKSGKWKKKHTRFFRLIMKLMASYDTEVIYLRGNHDDFLDQIIPITFGRFRLLHDYVYESKGKKYYVVHGDIFDSITTNLRWVALLGDIGYTFLLWLNKHYNNRRIKQGLPYYSLSQAVKAKVKSAVSYISKYEVELAKLAKLKNFDGVICGHIHQPAIATYDGVLYLNSGDWVESLTALTEDYAGNWEIRYYTDLQKERYLDSTDVETRLKKAKKLNYKDSTNLPEH